jgi:hypothetical protein
MSISVVVPVHNGQKTLAQCAQSLRTQTLLPDEILFIDNGSTDETPGILRHLATEDHRIKVHTLPKPGLVDALNFGINQAKGTFIARMDADDVCFPQRFEKQIRFFQEHPDTGVLGTFALGVKDSADPGFLLATPPEHESIFRSLRLPFPAGHFIHPTVMFCPERIQGKIRYRHGFPYAEDYDLWLRLSRQCKIANLPEPLIRYSLPSTSSSRSRYPYIPFRSCLTAWAEDRLQAVTDDTTHITHGLIHYFTIFKEEDLFAFAVMVLGYAIYMQLPLKLFVACYQAIERFGGASMAQHCMETIYPFVNFENESLKQTWRDFTAAIGFVRTGGSETQFVHESIRIFAHADGWEENDSIRLKNCTSIGQVLDSPLPTEKDSATYGLSVLTKIKHDVSRLQGRFNLRTREGYLGFLGFFLLFIAPNLPDYRLPEWIKLTLTRPSDSGKKTLNMLHEALWLSDEWLQKQYAIDTDVGQEQILAWTSYNEQIMQIMASAEDNG